MDLDDLYAAPYDQFISERNALVKRTDDKDEASRIKALRKPTLSAWAVNQVARSHGDELRHLVELSDRLRGARGEEVRSLSKERNAAVASLVERARAVLTDAGHSASAANIERITNTLQAASVDPEAVDDLVAGRLSTDMEPSGFASIPLALVEDAGEEDPSVRRKARAEMKKLQSEAARTEREAHDLERAADVAEEAAKAARRAARTARRRADKARAKAEEAAASQGS
jgi:hypothetical protein